MRRLEFPRAPGPLSWRPFASREAAQGFFGRLGPGHPPPMQLAEEHRAPDGGVLPAGTWVIVYRPIIQ